MKTLTKTIVFRAVVLTMIGLGVFASVGKTQEKSESSGGKPVKITKHYISIPGTTIAEVDQEAVEAILKKYDGSLYKIHLYKEGKKTKTWGELSDLDIGQDNAKEADREMRTNGRSSWTNRIGMGCYSYCPHPTPPTTPTPKPKRIGMGCYSYCPNPTPPTTPTPPTKKGASCHTNTCDPKKQSDDLVKAVTPILKKYSK